MVARDGPFLLHLHQEFVQFGVCVISPTFTCIFRVLFEYCSLVCSQCTPRLVALLGARGLCELIADHLSFAVVSLGDMMVVCTAHSALFHTSCTLAYGILCF